MSRERVKMSRANRAKQFMPFAALRGLPELLREKEIVEEAEKEIAEDQAEQINRILSALKAGDVFRVRYYENAAYRETEEVFERIEDKVLVGAGVSIPSGSIAEIEIVRK